ncbi:unnamed protein product [Amaranthus hypochondriacus]
MQSLRALFQCSPKPPSHHHSYPNLHHDSKFSLNLLSSQARTEDVSSLIDWWTNKKEKSSVVLVGECLSICEGVVRGFKERVEKGDEQVPLQFRYLQFLNCPLSSMKNLSREEIDLKLGEIRCVLKGCLGKGVVLYLGDLKWVSEYWAYYGEQRRHYYCPIEHLVMGLRRLVFGNLETSGRLWLMGIANFNSYLKCKSGFPSLETLLDLHPLTTPVGSLDLSLNLESSLQGQKKSDVSLEGISWPLFENKIDMQLTCCKDCSANCHREAQSLAGSYRNNDSTTTTTTTTTTTSSSLPSWLQKCKEESKEISTNHEETLQIKELCKKWNSICSTTHKTSKSAEKTLNISSCSPSSSSISSYDHNKNLHLHESKPMNLTSTWPFMFEPKWGSNQNPFFLQSKPEFQSNPNSTPNSDSSSEATETIITQFNHNNPENLEAICSVLNKKIPWQKDIIPEIATTVLRIRSGMIKRMNPSSKIEEQKKETWLLFMGSDDDGKLLVGRELAKLVFGSYTNFKSINLSGYSSTRTDSNDDLRPKRVRDEMGKDFLMRFCDLIKENPHRVFYIEDIEQIDHGSHMGIKHGIETGKIKLSNGEIVSLQDAIVIFSCESFSSASRACSPPIKQKLDHDHDHDHDDNDDVEGEATSCIPDLDLNLAFQKDENGGSDDQSFWGGDFRVLELVDKQVFFKMIML